MRTTKQYDYLNRLLSISSSSSLPISYAYAYNDANQRTRLGLADGSFWIHQYDALGQVISGEKYWTDGTPVPGQQFEYGFDDIGNRTSTKAGGDQSGAGLRPASYAANSLNQYTNRTVPSAFDVIGIASASSGVTVNSSVADYRRGEYFQELLGVSNSSTSVWQSVTVTTSGGGTNTGNVFVPMATETFGYDADGNMTNDGRWTFTWDTENRLASMQALSSVPNAAKKKLDFTYDYRGRRTQKIVSTWIGSSYVAQSTNKFLYDGWNMVAELNGTNGIIHSYLWGTDISGGMQGAGGVGGLLAIKPTGTNTLFVAYDGNGNVSGLIDATTGTTTGNFEYSPFGETIRLTPNANNQSPFRFSTKYTDDESDFLYYGFRYYSPSTGRWLSRDPIAERGGLNLYGFWENNLNDNVDAVGLQGYIGWVPPTEMPYPLLLHPIPPQSYPVPAFPLSVVDNKLNLNVKETSDLSWFQNDPDASRAMQRAKEYYEENIKKNRSLVCQGMMPTIPSFYSGTTQSAHYQESLLKLQKQTGKIEPEWPIPQGAFWSKVVLGSVEWRLTGFKTKKDGSLLYWEAEVSIVDKLGWEAAAYNPWPAMEKLAGPSREIVRGRFHVGGRMCCTSTAPSSSLTPLIVTP